MIQLLSKVNIIDNSGGSVGQCIKILDPHGRKYAKIGDIILLSIKDTVKVTNTNKKGANLKKLSKDLVKGSIFKALVVRTKVGALKSNIGKFSDNAVILLKTNNTPGFKVSSLTELPLIGTRIKGPLSLNLNTNIIKIKYPKFKLNISSIKLNNENLIPELLINKTNKYQKALSLTKTHI